MSKSMDSRRGFLRSASAAAVGLAGVAGADFARGESQSPPSSTGARPRIACIGLRYQGSVIAHRSQDFGDIVAVCDVDSNVREQARASFGSTPAIYEDYRDMLAAGGFDVVTIGAPDHWHAKMLIDSCRAGHDVYCEKPLTLSIDEGKHIRKAVAETGRIVQVGSWQRSDERFRLAAEMVRQGRIGALQKVEVVLGKNDVGGPFPVAQSPPNLNWELWQGQTPEVPFLYERSHYTFRWWYAYSGGQMTDWGAHHIDIAQWAIGEDPIEINGHARFPETNGGYDVAIDFDVAYKYPSGVVMTVSDTGRNGILFQGSKGRLFVNRENLTGKPVEQLSLDPLPREKFQLYAHDNLQRPPRAGKLDAIINHMGNFFDCVQTRHQPISDVESQHRSVSTCHLGNISMRLGRSLKWDPATETFPDDSEANLWLTREQRSGYTLS